MPLMRVASLVALLALGASFFVPVWWVSLKAPNYPAQTFPQGVRINFHVNRISNGCAMRESKEVLEKEALDCVHEMDTINHFVGMYPIASGGPVEKLLSPFLFSFLGVLIVGFAMPGVRLRTAAMALGFGGIAVWMSVALFAPNGVRYLDRGWVVGLVDSLGRAEDEATNEQLHPVVKQLKESLARSHLGEAPAPKAESNASKDQLIQVLKAVYEQKAPVSLTEPAPVWTGRGIDVMAWHYEESLGRWFNEPAKNERLVAIMKTSLYVVYGVVLAAMLVFLWVARKPRSLLFYALGAIPMILPVAFVMEYAAWLWWYGHSLNAMGAFTLKPFMPTVFGDGKVAQFSTHSYPYTGFALMCVVGAAMAVALLLRRAAPNAVKD
ncbi:hypothetical protein [Bradyrhizobium sp.]|uniref:hypothetical protein n=1 Tax=Bradyrhizobium sp. TaxID=376 RepID=UPI00238B5D24|nr:hypothetical protein [Bradyrhizobium sp.]MDE2375763.1 hypothetical protein [Bradyrhizobium sp.]